MSKSWEEINARIARGEAVVVTAEEFAVIAAEDGITEAARTVDVVTTSTLRAASGTPTDAATTANSSAVTTTASPLAMRALISSHDLAIDAPPCDGKGRRPGSVPG